MTCRGSSAEICSTKSAEPSRAHGVQDGVGGRHHLGLEVPDHPGGEPLVDQAPVAGVHGRVHVQHHHALLAQDVLVEVVEEGGGPVGREVLVVPVDPHAVVVAGHRPEAVGESGRVGVPLDRGLPAEVGEPLVGDPVHEAPGVTQIDVGDFHGVSPWSLGPGSGHGTRAHPSTAVAIVADDVSRTCISYHRPGVPDGSTSGWARGALSHDGGAAPGERGPTGVRTTGIASAPRSDVRSGVNESTSH